MSTKPRRISDQCAELAAMAADGLSVHEIEEITGIDAYYIEHAIRDFENAEANDLEDYAEEFHP